MVFNEKVKRRKSGKALLWNILTVLMLLAVACLLFYMGTIFKNPLSAWNPFPPEPSPTVYSTATPTITPLQPPATWTPSPTLKPPATRTRAPTLTPNPILITVTGTPTLSGTTAPSTSPTAMPALAEILYEASTSIHPDLACNWFGIGGLVLGVDNKPLLNQTVQLGGMLGKTSISMLQVSGYVTIYGGAGYEFKLGDKPVSSSKTLWIQLFDNDGNALTNRIYFDTHEDCNQNLVRITFKLIR